MSQVGSGVVAATTGCDPLAFDVIVPFVESTERAKADLGVPEIPAETCLMLRR
jgi:hypothetical protein